MSNYKKKRQNPAARNGKKSKGFRESETDSKNAESAGNFRRGSKRDHMSDHNDWRWYAANEHLLRNTAAIPLTHPSGAKETILYNGLSNEVNQSVPGIMSFDIFPAIGDTGTDPNAAVNVAARQVYTFVRHANSGAKNYDAPNLMMYFLAMDSLYSMYAWMKRAYGVLMTYSVQNKYYPKALVTAMGFDYENVSSHMPEFAALINTLAVKLNSMCVPATMAYTRRHMWLFEGLYLDSVSPKAQIYLFRPGYFYQYTYDATIESDTRSPFYLELIPNNTRGDIEALASLIDSLLNPIIASDSFNLMSGDILKAYGEGNIIRVPAVTTDYTVIPAYNADVLNQIQSMTIVGDPINLRMHHKNLVNGWDCNIYENVDSFTTYLTTQPAFELSNTVTLEYGQHSNIIVPGSNCLDAEKFVCLHSEDSGPADIMVATRLTNIADPNGGVVLEDDTNSEAELEVAYYVCRYPTLASEAVTRATIWYYGEGNSIDEWVLKPAVFGTSMVVEHYEPDANYLTTQALQYAYSRSRTSFYEYREITALLNHFARRPGIGVTWADFAVRIDDATKAPYALYVNQKTLPFAGWDIDLPYYGKISGDTLKSITDVALLSEFAIQTYGDKQ